MGEGDWKQQEVGREEKIGVGRRKVAWRRKRDESGWLDTLKSREIVVVMGGCCVGQIEVMGSLAGQVKSNGDMD